MASFFGEVVFPVSRAFWEEEDENGAAGPSVIQSDFSLRWLTEKPSQIGTLVVIEGEMLIDFSRECLCQNSEEVCFVENGQQKKMCAIYQVNDSVYLCIVLSKFDIKFSGKLVDKMADTITSAKNIICITSRHVSQFKCKNAPSVPSFLRMIVTKNGENVCKLKVPYLEQPNIVYGVTAGVLTYAELTEVPSVLYILYADSFVLDSVSVEPLLKLFATMNCTLHDVTFAGKDFFSKGNLYM